MQNKNTLTTLISAKFYWLHFAIWEILLFFFLSLFYLWQCNADCNITLIVCQIKICWLNFNQVSILSRHIVYARRLKRLYGRHVLMLCLQNDSRTQSFKCLISHIHVLCVGKFIYPHTTKPCSSAPRSLKFVFVASTQGRFLQILLKVARVGDWRLWYKWGKVYILSFQTDFQTANAFWAWLSDNINVFRKFQQLSYTLSQI